MVDMTLEVQKEDAKIATVEHHARASSKVDQNMASDAQNGVDGILDRCRTGLDALVWCEEIPAVRNNISPYR